MITVGLIGIIIYCIAPILYFLISKNRDEIHVIYAFTKEKSKHFELVNNFVKLFLICLGVLSESVPNHVRSLISIIILLGFYKWQSHIVVYERSTLNNIQSLSLISLCVTLYGGIFFLIEEVDETSRIVIAVIVMLINVIFYLETIRVIVFQLYRDKK